MAKQSDTDTPNSPPLTLNPALLNRVATIAEAPGRFHSGGVGIDRGDQLVHRAPFVADQLEAIHEALRSEIGSEKGSEIRSEIDAVILRDLAAEPTLSERRLAERLRLSQRAVEKHLAALQQQGRLLRHGSPRAGSWQVL